MSIVLSIHYTSISWPSVREFEYQSRRDNSLWKQFGTIPIGRRITSLFNIFVQLAQPRVRKPAVLGDKPPREDAEDGDGQEYDTRV
jgi:hypothetical protein